MGGPNNLLNNPTMLVDGGGKVLDDGEYVVHLAFLEEFPDEFYGLFELEPFLLDF